MGTAVDKSSLKECVSHLVNVLLADVIIISCYRTKCNHRRNLIIIATVIAVGNNILALCICGTDGSNYGVAKTITIMYSKDDNYVRYGDILLAVQMLPNTGITSTAAKLVWRRALELKGDCRTRRWVPFSADR